MLRTNSKKAVENIRAYILSGFAPENYNPDFWHDAEKEKKTAAKLDEFSVAAHFIFSTFYNEKLKHDNSWNAGRLSMQEAFLTGVRAFLSLLTPVIIATVPPFLTLRGFWKKRRKKPVVTPSSKRKIC